MATIFGDVTNLHQRHHPLKIPHLAEKITGFPLKAKSFRNTATCQKHKEGFHQPPPPPLYHGGGMTLRVCPRVKIQGEAKLTLLKQGTSNNFKN